MSHLMRFLIFYVFILISFFMLHEMEIENENPTSGSMCFMQDITGQQFAWATSQIFLLFRRIAVYMIRIPNVKVIFMVSVWQKNNKQKAGHL